MAHLINDPALFAHWAACMLFAICFLQSGIDKVVDWKGNLSWLTGHFEKSPLAKQVPLMLGVITVAELAAGVVAAVAVVALLLGPTSLGRYGLMMAAVTLLALFAGQRIAKDYAGAQTLAIYVGVALLGLLAS